MNATKPETQTHVTTQADFPLLVQLAAGLLASGHYTGLENPEDPDSPGYVKRDDLGKDWAESGAPCRYNWRVIEDTEFLLRMLRREIDFQTECHE